MILLNIICPPPQELISRALAGVLLPDADQVMLWKLLQQAYACRHLRCHRHPDGHQKDTFGCFTDPHFLGWYAYNGVGIWHFCDG